MGSTPKVRAERSDAERLRRDLAARQVAGVSSTQATRGDLSKEVDSESPGSAERSDWGSRRLRAGAGSATNVRRTRARSSARREERTMGHLSRREFLTASTLA